MSHLPQNNAKYSFASLFSYVNHSDLSVLILSYVVTYLKVNKKILSLPKQETKLLAKEQAAKMQCAF